MGTWPAPLRHLLLITLAGLLGWAGTDLIPWVHDQAGYGILASTLLTVLLAWVTPLVQAYGVGARAARMAAARRQVGTNR